MSAIRPDHKSDHKPAKGDVSQRWTNHLREKAKTTVNLSCPYCEDRAVQSSKQALWTHINGCHAKLIPPEDDIEATQRFRNKTLQQARGQLRSSDATPTKLPTHLNNLIEKPHSTLNPSIETATVPSGFTVYDNGISNTLEPSTTLEEPSTKRIAVGQGKSPSSSVSVHSSHSQESPKRLRAQVAYKNLVATVSPVQAQTSPPDDYLNSRPPTANKRLFEYDSSPSQNFKPPNAHNNTTRANQPRNRRLEPATSRSSPTTPTHIQKSLPGLKPGTIPVSIVTAKPTPPPLQKTPFSQSSGMASQPETRPISQEQLVAEVKGIYAGLIMVEGKCIQVDLNQAQLAREAPANMRPKLSNEQWQALIALHRTLLHEHHDFFLASQHPSTTPGVRRLAVKYAMPARLWKHGIHSFLELLRSRLPESLEHMLAFIYLAFNILTLLYETVPAFEDTWIECLGDLGRYRMAIEDNNARDIEVWTQVSRRWYLLAANRSTGTGRLYHHLAILARPDPLPQILYYGKALAAKDPFKAAKESIMTLFEPALNGRPIRRRDPEAIKAFILVQAILFEKTQLDTFNEALSKFILELNPHIGRVTETFRSQGYYIAIAACIALQGYKPSENCLMAEMSPNENAVTAESSQSPIDLVAFQSAQKLSKETLALALSRIGDPNVLSLIHVMLVFTVFISRYPTAMNHFAQDYPWEPLVTMLNAIFHVYETREVPLNMSQLYNTITQDRFPFPEKGEPNEDNGPIPEDWAMRGLIWTENYWPDGWFNPKIEAESHYIEKASVTQERRPTRILWLACRLAKAKWIDYNEETHKFSLTGGHSEQSPSRETESNTPSTTALGDEDMDIYRATPTSSSPNWASNSLLERSERTPTWHTTGTESDVWTTHTEDTVLDGDEHDERDEDRMDTGGCPTPAVINEPETSTQAG